MPVNVEEIKFGTVLERTEVEKRCVTDVSVTGTLTLCEVDPIDREPRVMRSSLDASAAWADRIFSQPDAPAPSDREAKIRELVEAAGTIRDRYRLGFIMAVDDPQKDQEGFLRLAAALAALSPTEADHD